MTRKQSPKIRTYIIIFSISLIIFVFLFICASAKKNSNNTNSASESVIESSTTNIYTEPLTEPSLKESEKKNETTTSKKDEDSVKGTEKREVDKATSKKIEQEKEKISSNTNDDFNDTKDLPQIEISQKENMRIEGDKESVDNIKINYQSITLNKADILTLQLINAKDNISWKSENEKVIKITSEYSNKCMLQAVGLGSTKVIASYNNKNYTCNITVN